MLTLVIEVLKTSTGYTIHERDARYFYPSIWNYYFYVGAINYKIIIESMRPIVNDLCVIRLVHNTL